MRRGFVHVKNVVPAAPTNEDSVSRARHSRRPARETAAETVAWRAFVLHLTVMPRSSGANVYEFRLNRTEAIRAVAGILNSDGALNRERNESRSCVPTIHQ